MRRARAVYHQAIRQVQRIEDSIVRQRVAYSLLDKDCRDFWAEVKRIRGNLSGSVRIVDGQCDPYSLSKMFASKFRELCSSLPYNNRDMQNIVANVETKLKNSCVNEDCVVAITQGCSLGLET
jgi:hypothetical protein